MKKLIDLDAEVVKIFTDKAKKEKMSTKAFMEKKLIEIAQKIKEET